MLNELGEDGEAFLDHFVADAIADPEIAGAAKAVAGDDQQILCLGPLRKCVGISAGGFDKEVKCTVRTGNFIT